MHIERFFVPGLAHVSYVVASGGEAAVVDPERNVDGYLLLNNYVSMDPNPENEVAGPNITFTGANIHIVSGSGATDDGTLAGLGKNHPHGELSGQKRCNAEFA